MAQGAALLIHFSACFSWKISKSLRGSGCPGRSPVGSVDNYGRTALQITKDAQIQQLLRQRGAR